MDRHDMIWYELFVSKIDGPAEMGNVTLWRCQLQAIGPGCKIARTCDGWTYWHGPSWSSLLPIGAHPCAANQELSSGNGRQASLKVTCYCHSKCEFFRKVSTLPPNADALAREWLLHGYRAHHFRNEGHKHIADITRFFPWATTSNRYCMSM